MYTTFIRLVTHGCSLEYLYNEMSTTAMTTMTTTTKSSTEKSTTPAQAAATLKTFIKTETKTRTFCYPLNNIKSMEMMSSSPTLPPTPSQTRRVTEEATLKTTTNNTKHFLPHLLKAKHIQSQKYQHEQHDEILTPTTNDPNNTTTSPYAPLHTHSSSSSATTAPTTVTLTTTKSPLFEVKLELSGMQIRFQPTFESNVKNNFQQIVEQLLQDISQACDCMPRIFHDTAALSDEWCDIYVEDINENKLIHDFTTTTKTTAATKHLKTEIHKAKAEQDEKETDEDNKMKTTAMTNTKVTSTAKGIISFKLFFITVGWQKTMAYHGDYILTLVQVI